ncbi:18335_t:CDS:2, partial [Entrophospora sp. SA101]
LTYSKEEVEGILSCSVPGDLKNNDDSNEDNDQKNSNPSSSSFTTTDSMK